MGANPSKVDACNIKGAKNVTIYDIDDGVIDEWTPGANHLGNSYIGLMRFSPDA